MENVDTNTQRRSLRLILLLVFISYAGFSLPFPILTPLFLETESSLIDAGCTYPDRTFLLGVAIAIYSLGQFAGSIVLGLLSDRHGRKPVLIGSLAGSAAAYMLCAYAICVGSVEAFISGRLMGGFCEGSTGIGQAFAADISDNDNRVGKFSLINTAASLGWVIGPLLGSVLAKFSLFGLHRHTTLFIVTGTAAAAMLILFTALFQDVPRRHDRLDLWESCRTLFRGEGAHLFGQLLAVNFIIVASFACFQQFFPTLLVSRFDATEVGIGICYTVLSVAWVLAQQLVVTPLGRRLTPQRAFALFSGGLVLSLVALTLSFHVSLIALSLILIATTASGALTNATAWTSVLSQGDLQGAALGLNRAVHSLARASPALFAGYLAGVHAALPIAAGALLAGSAWALGLYLFETRVRAHTGAT